MNYTFNANEVVCNGVGGYAYQSSIKSKDLMVKIVESVRENLGLDEIYKLAMEKDKFKDLYAGYRFESVDEIVFRLATGLGGWGFKKFGEAPELIEMNIKHILETITQEDAITIVVEAHRACASADHWYTFEKQWD